MEGTITKGIGGFYYVNTKNGVYECRARGIFRKNKITPLVGDKVEISIIDEAGKKGSLDTIYERKNMLIRPKVSNCTQAVIVFAAVKPNINFDLLNRFLIIAEEQKLEIVICINKIDLDNDEGYLNISRIYEDAGYKVILMSAKKGIGIDELKNELMDKISVFAGPSGVGKSSIINALNPDLNLKTGDISEKIERGKHTTRHAELMKLFDKSYIVDSPGFTSLYLEHIEPGDLQYYFREFKEFLPNCKYSGCMHIKEASCGVKEALGRGISKERYDSYVYIYTQLEEERKKQQ